ncbi:glycosyltransferase [Fischerella sp. PCC 9605]|uniref:glycosyltransferase n=1 Tax=Fischerella sp. PCC 9605 TaxID=1173024 RepID=UPI0004B5716F|nr:glycosyltransferase [Fischerella sp. PCC 9605]
MNIEQPLVTILINNYNYALYIKDALNSALNQTYPNTEIIVVDDGSTDRSREIIAGYEDKIIPIYKENGGQASAFNAGFAVSQGKIICFLDSDDVWLPQKVEKVVEAFNTYPKAAVVYHKVENIDTAGKIISAPWPPYKPIKGDISSQVARTGGWWPFPPSTALSFSRDFLCKVMNIPEAEYRICADSYLADLAPFLGEVVGIDRVLSQYRTHGSNNWSNSSGAQKDTRDMRILLDHEFRAKMLNSKLKDLGIDREVNLAGHWPYQLLKYKLGNRTSLVLLSLLALQNPWETKLPSKLNTVVKLWLERRSLNRI